MKKLENSTLQKFLDNFVEHLKYENENRKLYNEKEIDIPFIISSLYQSFHKEISKYSDFISDLEHSTDYWFDISDGKKECECNGIIDVDIILKISHDYQLQFTYDTRNYGYCECTPDMADYRKDKDCCGHGCDADFCRFSLHKVLHIVSGSWQGDEHDYWDFEDEFYKSDKELAEKKEREDKEKEIKELKSRIETAQKRLNELGMETKLMQVRHMKTL